MSLLALGAYARDLDDKALNEYEAKFGDFLYGKYAALVENYGIVRFHAINAERVGLHDALVHLIIYRKGDAVDTDGECACSKASRALSMLKSPASA